MNRVREDEPRYIEVHLRERGSSRGGAVAHRLPGAVVRLLAGRLAHRLPGAPAARRRRGCAPAPQRPSSRIMYCAMTRAPASFGWMPSSDSSEVMSPSPAASAGRASPSDTRTDPVCSATDSMAAA